MAEEYRVICDRCGGMGRAVHRGLSECAEGRMLHSPKEWVRLESDGKILCPNCAKSWRAWWASGGD